MTSRIFILAVLKVLIIVSLDLAQGLWTNPTASLGTLLFGRFTALGQLTGPNLWYWIFPLCLLAVVVIHTLWMVARDHRDYLAVLERLLYLALIGPLIIFVTNQMLFSILRATGVFLAVDGMIPAFLSLVLSYLIWSLTFLFLAIRWAGGRIGNWAIVQTIGFSVSMSLLFPGSFIIHFGFVSR